MSLFITRILSMFGLSTPSEELRLQVTDFWKDPIGWFDDRFEGKQKTNLEFAIKFLNENLLEICLVVLAIYIVHHVLKWILHILYRVLKCILAIVYYMFMCILYIVYLLLDWLLAQSLWDHISGTVSKMFDYIQHVCNTKRFADSQASSGRKRKGDAIVKIELS